MSKLSQLYQELTDDLIRLLETGELPPWKPGWTADRNTGSPASILSSEPVGNFATKKDYTGINFVILAMASQRKGYAGRWWATYKQWQKLGAHVKNGEHGTKIVYFGPKTTAKAESEEEDEDVIIKWHTLFNIAQVDGDGLEKYRVGHPAALLERKEINERLHKAEDMIAATGAKITFHGSNAYYNSTSDRIHVPKRSRFSDDHSYYGVVFHELIHWTGHRKRLNRLNSKHKGDDAYCFEELVAEIGACFTAVRLGIPISEHLPNHAAYLAHWLEGLSNDSKFIVRAASAASRASNYLLKIKSPSKPHKKPRKQRRTAATSTSGASLGDVV